MKLIHIILCSLTAVLISQGMAEPPVNAFPPLSIIKNKNASDTDLLMALMKLDPHAEEGCLFWSNIANDETYRNKQRLLCIYELFKRYVPNGSSLEQLKVVLNNPKWIQAKQVKRIKAYTGHIPINSMEGSIFQIWVFSPGPAESSGALFIRVSGDIEEADFMKLLLGQKVGDDIGHAIIREIGYF